MSPVEIIGHFAKTDEDEDGGGKSVIVDKTGHFVNLRNGSLRELQTGLWGGRVWKEMYEVAVFTANKTDAVAQGLKLRLLSAEAKAIVDKLPAGDETQKDEAAATNLGGNLEVKAQSGGAEQGSPDAKEGKACHSPYSAARRASSGAGVPAGLASKGG